MTVSDEMLVQKSIKGNYEAFAELIKKYSNLVYAVAISKMKDFHLAEDVAQEVFVKAWKNLGRLDDVEKFSSWLVTITRNQCLDELRKKGHIKEEALISENAIPVDSISLTETREMIWTALDTLEEKYKLVVVMNYISGYTAKEISNLLHISQSAIESRLRRAKEKLKKELLDVMADTFGEKRVGENFEEEVMWRIVPRIATIELPVSNIENSITWYREKLGIKAVHHDETAAMLHLQGGNRVGVPTIYLVQTDEQKPINFKNTNTGVIHSVIDFYMPDLERFHSFLKEEGVKVTDLNFFPGSKMGGFGFEDPDGNLLSVTNVTHSGQEG